MCAKPEDLSKRRALARHYERIAEELERSARHDGIEEPGSE
jgi:hypothetical protein